MKSKTTKPVDLMFKASSDPTRLRVLHLLQDGEMCVCHIVDILRVPQPTASRHLAYLRRAGLVQTRRAGLWTYYRLAPAQNAFHEKLIECLRCCFRDVPQFQRDRARASLICKTSAPSPVTPPGRRVEVSTDRKHSRTKTTLPLAPPGRGVRVTGAFSR